jgi:bifunctional NMN adenylyltransferase/nudix hydrolase
MSKAKLGIIIGRFQPLHDGHRKMIQQVSTLVDRILILVGSANSARTVKNPWTYSERKNTIRNFAHSIDIEVEIAPLNDYLYSDTQWIADVQRTIDEYNQEGDEVVILGHMKEGNDYLNWFPGYKFQGLHQQMNGRSATDIRTAMFMSNDHNMPSSVMDDWKFYQKEKELFADYPFPETLNFNCSDALVLCAGHVLLIKRKFAPGAGTWALPGGFKNRNETFFDCAVRELFEETNLRVPEKVIRGSVVSTKMFDNPKRSIGIPRNSLVVMFKIELDKDGSLPRANGCDDAAETRWVSVKDAINNYPLFDDHKHILSMMLNVTPVPAYVSMA